MLEELGALSESGVGILVELSTLFAVNTPDLIERIADGIEARNLDQFERAAHTLKGSAAQLGAVRVSAAAAAELVKLARAGEFQGTEPHLVELDAAFAASVAEYRAIANRIRPGSAPSHPPAGQGGDARDVACGPDAVQPRRGRAAGWRAAPIGQPGRSSSAWRTIAGSRSHVRPPGASSWRPPVERRRRWPAGRASPRSWAGCGPPGGHNGHAPHGPRATERSGRGTTPDPAR